MPKDDLNALGIENRSTRDEAPSMSLDAEVRGFTGLLVGLVIGMATWGLVFMVWWLV
jgi:hypothetical protein